MKYEDTLICQNVKRITQLLPNIQELVSKIDMSTSNVYDRSEASNYISILREVLNQMDSDLSALDILIDD